jgi:hypothetical protein
MNALDYKRYLEGAMAGMKVTRYSWWAHWRELADFFLPRRYRWLVTANQMNRGSPINGHIIDSTGCFAARNLAAGLLSGKSSPHRQWFKLKVGYIDSTGTNPISLWLAECERLLRLIYQSSNFYNSIAQFYADLVVFGTACLLIYEDFDNVIRCINPCLGEYYVGLDGKMRPCILFREFTMTIGQVVDEFGIDNVSESVRLSYNDRTGGGRTREIVVCHAIEPNTGQAPSRFAFAEAFWERGGSQAQQTGTLTETFLRRKGFYEQPMGIVRWDIQSNDPYGRAPAMDGLGDQKQLQQETRRKAQAIDKMVNPPLGADIALKNQPASLLPGGITYGAFRDGKPTMGSLYDTKFPVGEINEDLTQVRDRLRKVFYNDLFQTASQFETRSNITAVEWDMRKSESMIMLGPVVERIDTEGLSVFTERVFNIASRAGIIPPPPQEIAGMEIDVDFVSILAQSQEAAAAASIERVFGMVGQVAGVVPEAIDKLDVDYSIDKYSTLLSNDPKVIRSQDQVAAIRKARHDKEAAMQQAEVANQLADGAKTLSETDVGAGQNALQMLTGAA